MFRAILYFDNCEFTKSYERRAFVFFVCISEEFFGFFPTFGKLIRIAVLFGDQNNIIGAFFWHVLVPLRANELVLGGYARALVKFVMVRNSATMLRTSADPVERPVELHSAMA